MLWKPLSLHAGLLSVQFTSASLTTPNNMNSLNSRLRALLLTSALGLMTVGHLTAQTTAKPVAPKLDDDEAIVLSPFVVSAAEDAGYTAKNTLAGTRVRTELKEVG